MIVPIIRLEVEAMRHTIQVALSQHSAQLDQNIQSAIEEYCTADNIERVVKKAAAAALDVAIKEEVDRFFRYGAGREAVAASVKESILKKKTYTSLDYVE